METCVLIDELLVCLLGCRGPLVSVSQQETSISEQYLSLLSESQRQLITRDLLPCIDTFSRISEACAQSPADTNCSAYMCALFESILSSCVQPYTLLVTEIEAERLSSVSYPLLTLKCRLDHWPLTHNFVGDLIQDVAEQQLDGAVLVNHIEALLHQCPESSPLHVIYSAVASAVTSVLSVHLSRWLVNGRLPAVGSSDAAAFFIEDGRIVVGRCPPSIRAETLENILFVGLHATSSDISLPFKDQVLRIENLAQLPKLLSKMSTALSGELVKRIDMINYLEVIRQSFCLGAGWLFEAATIDLHGCNRAFRELIRRSNRKDTYPFSVLMDVTKRHESAPVWSVGSADSALSHIFTDECLTRFREIFSFLLQVKHISATLNASWKSKSSKSVNHNRMLLCINSIQRYCFLDVIHMEFRNVRLTLERAQLGFSDLQQLIHSLSSRCYSRLFLAKDAQYKLIQNIIDSCRRADYEMFSRYYGLLYDVTGIC